ncbi:MAG: Do family serine endopeptidase [Acidobacteria bacterium]|nr:Do family serine endopeptidase [Acidobacteriota bacterium]MSO62088.1 Do family serine endopeptidase [Acidobacteriota bacterium]
MSSRKTTLFYSLLIMVASLAVGMVIASRLDLAPASSAQTMAAPPMNSAPLSGPVDAATFRNIAKAMSPAVVNIRSTSTQRAQETEMLGGGNNDLLERFFGGQQDGRPQQRPRQPREQETQAAGTGFVISKDGFILTNNHVVEGATKIEVNFLGEENDVFHEAKLVGRDPLTDSALIQLVEAKKDLMEVKFGDSSRMEPGDWVMAIGNPFGLSHTVSVGVISATARSFPIAEQRFADVLQTDAAINPGNSGGPLLNARGEVIGINTAIYTDSRNAGNIGIGFAIPINSVRELIPQLRSGKVTRGVIGVQVTPVPADALAEFGLKERKGALVGAVSRGQPAAKAGIEPGDVIIEFNGKPIKNRDELVATVVVTKPGTTVPVKVLRDREERTLNLTVGELDLADEGNRAAATRETATEPDEQASQGFGLTLGPLTAEVARRLRAPGDTQGVLVSDVEQGSPAFRQGLTRGDIITQVNRRPVRTPPDAGRALAQVPSGGTAFLLVIRAGQEQFFTVRKE